MDGHLTASTVVVLNFTDADRATSVSTQLAMAVALATYDVEFSCGGMVVETVIGNNTGTNEFTYIF